MAQFLIERKWGAQLKTHGIQFEMEALGVSRCLMRNIRVTDSVWMEALEVSYGFCQGKDAGFRPEIRSLMVSGLKINAFRDHQGNFRIRGLELPVAKENSSRPSSLDMKTLFLWMPRRIRIENSSLHLDLGDQELYLPFHLDIHGNPGTQEMSCTGQVQIQGNILGLAWERLPLPFPGIWISAPAAHKVVFPALSFTEQPCLRNNGNFQGGRRTSGYSPLFVPWTWEKWISILLEISYSPPPRHSLFPSSGRAGCKT